MERPIISIITCVRNQEKYLPYLLKSIEKQTNLSFEHVLVDGKSSDKTPELLQAYKSRNQEKFPIQLLSKEPKGIADAMNIGISHAKGDWIIVVHGDDYLRSDHAVTAMLSAIKQHPESSWIIGNAIRQYGSFVFMTRMHWARGILVWLLRYLNFLSHQNTLMHKSLFTKYVMFRTDFPVSMDRELFLRLLCRGIHPTSVDEGFVVFRRHLGSLSFNPINLVSEDAKVKRIYREYRLLLHQSAKSS